MKLDFFEFITNRGLADEWKLEQCQFNQINLIVGKNASGKSQIVNAIHLLSEILLGASFTPFSMTYEWYLVFDIDRPQSKTEYRLKVDKNLRIEEELKIEEKIRLKRDLFGKGIIFAEELDRDINFQIPEQELAIVKRRDFIQHPFLEKIHQWSNSVRFYEFSTPLGRDIIVRIPQKLESLKNKTDLKDYNHIVRIFALGEKEIGHNFKETIVEDMNKIDYNISELGIKFTFPLIHNISVSDNQENLPQFLYVQENDLNSITEQSIRAAIKSFLKVSHPDKATRIPIRVILAVMEIEAWFLAEYNFLARLDERLTPDFILKHCGFELS
ncbi:MAG: AAA family ATPase [Cyanobacteria bacterium SBLK]|nr:AAA family ATPase [Cyanobacteria bacterium SBLK]